jgi:hypothetical protein
MRQFLLYALLLLLGFKYSNGQEYFKLLRPNVSWDVRYWEKEQWCPLDGLCKFFIKSDTLINDQTYQEIVFHRYQYSYCYPTDLYLDTTEYHYSYLREDTISKKVYIYYGGCGDLILYDFSLHKNDSIKIYHNWDCNDSVRISIDSTYQFTLLNGRKVKRLDNYDYFNDGWKTYSFLEGIGNLWDPFDFIPYPYYNFEGGSYLECVTDNGTVIYGEPILWNIVDTKQANHIGLYPNPASDNINIKFDGFVDIDDILLVNTLGIKYKVSWSCIGDNLIKSDISGLPTGIYFIIIRQVANLNCAFIKY